MTPKQSIQYFPNLFEKKKITISTLFGWEQKSCMELVSSFDTQFCHISDSWAMIDLFHLSPSISSTTHLSPHPIPQGHPSAPALSILSHASNLDW